MAPGNSDRHSSHTGTIPKTKIRNNCNVPQEVVTPTRREMSSNLVTTSLDWVPVSEYNTRTNYNQARKPSNNSSDHELTDLDNAVSFESGFGRFVPVRPQPRALPLNAQNRDNLAAEQSDDGGSNSAAGHSLHPYAHQLQNGMIPHTNHAAAAVMIVNPTTPNASTANIAQPYNAPSQSRNNLTRNLNTTRNNFEGNIHASNNNATSTSTTRTGTKTVNLINNMYEQVQGNFNNLNENGHRETVRALGEAIVAACPDTASVERRLGQIREYIRVTSSLVDTMRNSEDEAFIEHTKEEYDELIGMIKTLKESESKLELILKDNVPDNTEVLIEEINESIAQLRNDAFVAETDKNANQDKTCKIKSSNDNTVINNNLKKITNIENDQYNVQQDSNKLKETTIEQLPMNPEPIIVKIDESNLQGECSKLEIEEKNAIPYSDPNTKKDHENLNDVLRRNILSCVEKVQLMEEIKNKNNETSSDENQQENVVRPLSVQSNGSAYSESELWQNEIKNKMEMSQLRLAALKQQQKRLLKYQEEAKQQLDEINRERQSQEMHPSTSHDNLASMQGQPISNYHPNRMYAANQIGVATTLPHSSEAMHGAGMSNNLDNDHGHLAHSNQSNDDRMSLRETVMSNEDMTRGEDSEIEEDEAFLSEQGRILQHKLRELHLKKQHMENLVSEFQKLQMATRQASSRNTYSSSGDDSGEDEQTRKCNKSGSNMKNEDPYKLMEIKAIKAALQKTKDLMRSVENYEVDHLAGVTDESFQTQQHINIHDNKSEGGGSAGGWSNDGSLCRVRNSLSQRHKFTNEQSQQQVQQQLQNQTQQQLQHQSQQQVQHQSQQQLQQQSQQLLQQAHQHLQQQLQHQSYQLQHQSQQMQHQTQQLQHQSQHQQQQSHEANLASLQELAQELRLETEKIIGERTRIKDMVSNKDRKQKKVNEEVQAGPSSTSVPGPAERRQMQLRALLADKQRELEALINKETSSGHEAQIMKTDSRTASIVNQSYNSEQEEPDSRSEQVPIDSQDSRDSENYRGGGDSARPGRSLNMLPQHIGSAYDSESDTASRTKSNQRPRARRRQSQDRQSEDNNGVQANNTNQNARLEPRIEQTNVNMVPPTSQNGDSPGNIPYPYLQQPCWNTNKSNQDMRTNQFTQNSHSQTMERLLGTPQMSFPPSMPFNVMMPYGMVGGCSCGCGFWGAWCWQQFVMQQREIQQLREQLNHLEERWRSENASHTLNNQVPPGNRANNYWDNFRSYSRQNLLSTNSKTNADGHLGAGSANNPHPLVERSHNTLHHASSTPPSNTPKRNTNAATSTTSVPHSTQSNNDESNRTSRNNAYERSLSFSSAPDVLNINQNSEPDSSNGSHTRNLEDITSVPNVNINRQEVASNSFRNLNITNPIPEIIQSHSNNLNTSANSKKKSSSKLPAKNSTNRRNASLSYSETSNVNIISTSEAPNPNLASTSKEVHDKASSKLFDLLRENVYSEVTALIGVNESHPDFLIQLFRELQLISSEPLRQRVLQSIRNVLSQYSTIIENDNPEDDTRSEPPGTSSEVNHVDRNSSSSQNACSSTVHIDNNVVHFLLQRCDEICTAEFLEALVSLVTNSIEGRQQSKKRLVELLSKYEGMRVCEVSSDIIENLAIISSNNEGDESTQLTSELSESSILQDVAGSLNLFSSSDTQLHQLNSCPYDIWPAHMHMDMEAEDGNDNTPRSSQEGKVDLINCSDMHNGDLAEADQTCRSELSNSNHEMAQAETLPDVVDTEEATPTEAEAEWLGLDRVPTRLHMEEASGKQKD